MKLPSTTYKEQLKLTGLSESGLLYRSKKWFEKVYIDRVEPPKEKNLSKYMIPGRAYTFTYDAKYKDKLEFWDILPHMSICIGHVRGKNGINALAINLSYIPPRYRMAVIDKIFKVYRYKISKITDDINEKGYSPQHFNLEYKQAKAILRGSGWEFAIRSYIYTRIVTEPLIISYEDWWRPATFPSSFIVKKTIRQIYYLYKTNLISGYKIGTKEGKPKL